MAGTLVESDAGRKGNCYALSSGNATIPTTTQICPYDGQAIANVSVEIIGLHSVVFFVLLAKQLSWLVDGRRY